ncbi:hypothetical protein [Methanosphaera sp. WGK6]|uniref:hypothetical protein n=1 Tax=Methanosphaera sp. WGK6 TaxID=1561964 RepID=UPI00084CC38A|nr:hypothetical protein [Methanosphaera sp. WGK6]OED30389.1 hypothetical protein NL43_03200 [Methanosphaera sp. WGK6]
MKNKKQKTRYIYYIEQKNKYRVSKTIDGKQNFYGLYDTLEEAEKVRDKLLEHNWSKEYYEKNLRKEDTSKKSEDMQYIYLVKDTSTYSISKQIKNKKYSFGRYKTIEEAKKARDELQAHDWSIDFYKKNYKQEQKKDKYILQQPNGKFTINKKINEKTLSFGTFNTIDEARKHRDFCQENNWNLNCRKNKRNNHVTEDEQHLKYIQHNKTREKYIVHKFIKNKNIHFGTYNTLEEAMKIRDMLVEHEWSMEYYEKNIKKELKSGAKYIIKNKHNSYAVKRHNSSMTFLSKTYPTLEEAVKVRDDMIKHNWDKEYYEKKYKNEDNKYLIKQPGGKYTVSRSINGKTLSFGTFNTLDEARKHRDFCQENNWDDTCRKTKRNNHVTKDKHLKYITHDKTKLKYVVHKMVNGKFTYFGTYNTLEEAMKIRDLLVEHEWDKEYYQQLKESK